MKRKNNQLSHEVPQWLVLKLRCVYLLMFCVRLLNFVYGVYKLPFMLCKHIWNWLHDKVHNALLWLVDHLHKMVEHNIFPKFQDFKMKMASLSLQHDGGAHSAPTGDGEMPLSLFHPSELVLWAYSTFWQLSLSNPILVKPSFSYVGPLEGQKACLRA